MKITILQTGSLQTNTYLFDCGEVLAVVDPGAEPDKIMSAAQKLGKPIGYVLLTHSHFDHVGAVSAIQYSGATVYLHSQEVSILQSDFTPDALVEDGDMLNLGNQSVTVMHTPGHTAGSVCYIIDDVMFSGDTLFRLEIGRCDLPTGSFATMKKTLKRLLSIKKDYRVLPGHGEESTLEFERLHNRYAKGI